jgi:hypothetical protein
VLVDPPELSVGVPGRVLLVPAVMNAPVTVASRRLPELSRSTAITR